MSLSTADEPTAVEGYELRLTKGCSDRMRAFLSFADDLNEERTSEWTGECIDNVVYLRSYHDWFTSTAHAGASSGRELDAQTTRFERS